MRNKVILTDQTSKELISSSLLLIFVNNQENNVRASLSENIFRIILWVLTAIMAVTSIFAPLELLIRLYFKGIILDPSADTPASESMGMALVFSLIGIFSAISAYWSIFQFVSSAGREGVHCSTRQLKSQKTSTLI